MITKQGLQQSLWVAVEFGFKCREKNMNLQATLAEATPMIQGLVDRSDLKEEILHVISKKVSRKK